MNTVPDATRPATEPRPGATLLPVSRGAAARSALWSVIENGGLALISFTTLIIYSRFLSIAEFGVFSVALALVELLAVIVAMLFHDTLVQRADVSELHFDTAFTSCLGLGLLLMAACVVGAPMFAAHAGNPDAAAVLIWTSLCIPLTASGSTIVARQRRNLAFRTLAVRSLAGRMAGASVGTIAVMMGAGFWALVAQQVLIVFCGSLVLWVTCRERPRLRFSLTAFRELIAFGGFSIAALFVGYSVKRLFVILSGFTLGAHAAGLLDLSFRVIHMFWSLASSAISQIVLPVMSRLQNDADRLRRAFKSASALCCLVLYFSFVMIGSIAPELVTLLFGKSWIAIAPCVTALSFQVAVQAPRLMVAPVLTALGRPRDLLVAQTAELLFVLTAIYVSGVPTIAWAIGIWIAREFIGGPIGGWMLRRATSIGWPEQLRGTVVPLCAAAAMFGVLSFVRPQLAAGLDAVQRLLMLVPLGVIAYATVVFVLDRALLLELFGFARDAIRRKHGPSPEASP